MSILYDVVIYKPPQVTISLVNGEYVVIKPPGFTIQAINGRPPVEALQLIKTLAEPF